MKYFIIGYPLSGKSTIGKELAKMKKIPYLGTGAYARSLGMTMEQSIKEKDFSEKFNDAIEAKVWETINGGDCVIDGYPRTEAQVDKILSLGNKKVIYCYANPIVISERLKQRVLTESRQDDVDDIVSARVKAAMELQKIVETYIDIYKLDTGDGRAMSQFWREI